MKTKKIIILGGGFGGVQSALQLSKKLKNLKTKNNYQITVVDKYNYHTFTPLLYEIATTPKETSTYKQLKELVTYKFNTLFKNTNIQTKQSEVKDIDIKKKIINLKGSKLSFDYLVLALGSETNDFNIPGIKKHALKLKTFDDAISIRNKIVSKVQDKNDNKTINVVIGGAGSTGVELAGEIRKWACQLEERDTPHTCTIEVILIQSANTILPNFQKKVIKQSQKRLVDLGVKIQTSKTIKEVTENKVTTDDHYSIPYDVMIWTAGIKASLLTKEMPVEKEKTGRVETVNKLECIPNNKELRTYKNIYAIGDISCIYNPETGQPTPAVARVAMIQGKIAAHNIIEDIKLSEGLKRKTRKKTYRYKKYPYIIPLGGKYAVAQLGRVVFSGLFAWIFKGIVELNYLLSILSPREAIKVWIKGLKVFIKNDRLG